MKKSCTALLLAACLFASIGQAEAGEWKPDRPITIMVGFNPGGGIDAMARSLAPALEKVLGVSVIVENMPGSASGVAAEYVVNKDPDGLTLFGCSSSICIFSTTENSDVTYHDLEILAMPFTTHNLAVIVKADSGLDTMDDFLKYIKAEDTTASNAGIGSVFHIPAAILADILGIRDNVTHVPYNSGKETTLAVARGECDWSTSGIFAESRESIAAGMVKPLAILNAEAFELPGYGTVPSILDSVPEMKPYIDFIGGWRGFGVRADTPEHIKAALTKALEQAMKDVKFGEFLKNNGVDPKTVLDGKQSQELFEMSSRVFSWILFDLGDSPRSPDKVNVPRP